jgi:hypothetical protein
MQISARLKGKFLKDYGRNVAPLLRQTSPIPWDWDIVLNLQHEVNDLLLDLGRKQHPFDRGIWIVTNDGASPKIYRVAPERGSITDGSDYDE